jgi:glycosyltransferase involved in cell wall biosynthesis
MFSVIICTYNPDWNKLNKVLDAIAHQTLPTAEWEWIIVDNASTKPVIEDIPTNLQSRIKVLEEKEPGLTPARLCGIKSAQNDWLVFIDDDNILRADYLSSAKALIQQYATLGALGGRLVPMYEQSPSKEVIEYLFMLAIRTPTADEWGSDYAWNKTPFGAGMVIRKSVALQYAHLVVSDPLRKGLDRRGDSLMSSGDIDMAHTAVDMGYDTGVFVSLELTHIIPAVRVSKAYLKKMMRYNALSNHLLFFIRFKRLPKPVSTWRRAKQHLRLWKNREWFQSAMLRARDWGTREAIERISKMTN